MTFEQAIQILSQEHGAHQGTWTVPAVSPTLVESIMWEGQEGKVFHRFGKTLIATENVIGLAEFAQREHEAKIQEIADLVFD
jgi:hypothetical protein